MKKISVIIASKDKTNQKLRECLQSIKMQNYPQDKIEVLVITEGTPESAKAIGLKKATGDIVCIVASDCRFPYFSTFKEAASAITKGITGAYSERYYYDRCDPILNRYFALFGCNDPVPLYLGKCDRKPYYHKSSTGTISFPNSIPTLGDNGFFIKKSILLKTDLEHYSHIDNCEDLRKLGYYKYYKLGLSTHHQTGDSLWLWAKKRLHYAESLNQNRRWKMIANARDGVRLIIFILLTLTMLEPFIRSCYGFLKSGIRDVAWFLHPLVCLITLITYGALCLNGLVRRLQSLFVPRIGQKN